MLRGKTVYFATETFKHRLKTYKLGHALFGKRTYILITHPDKDSEACEVNRRRAVKKGEDYISIRPWGIQGEVFSIKNIEKNYKKKLAVHREGSVWLTQKEDEKFTKLKNKIRDKHMIKSKRRLR